MLSISFNLTTLPNKTLTYTIDSANTWERKSVTFTGDTSGVINDDNGVGFSIQWWLHNRK